MAETFYSALGVESEADADTIRQAYRERVKRRHPDVSDDPGAPREFRRLTTARDVLTDEAERERYDRLGHASYVERHLETSVWTAGETSGSSGTSTGGSHAYDRHRASRTGEDHRAAWLGEDWDGPRDAGRAHTATGRQRSGSAGATSSGATAEAGWQHASETYRYQPSSVPTEPETVRTSVRRLLGSLGPWLVVHLIFVGTAIATAWYTYASTGLTARFSLPALAFGVLLVGLVLLLSALHVVSLLYG